MIQQVVSHSTPNISVLSTVLQATVQHILLTRLKFLHIAPIQYPSTYTILLSSCSLKRFTVRIVNRGVLFFCFFSLWPCRFNLYFLPVPCVFCYLSPCLFIPSVCCSLPRLRQIPRLFVIEAERDCSFEFGLEKYRGSNDAANETCVRGERELRKSAVEIAPNHPPDRGKNFPLLLWGS